MSDLITQLCQVTAEILKANPQGDSAELVELVKKRIDADSQLGDAIQSDRLLTQINRDGSKGYQTLVKGGVANIGNTYLSDVKPEMLQEILQRVLADVLKSQPQVKQTAKPIPSNVAKCSPNFVGREEELTKIHANLQAGRGVIICALEGMGGVGKTELALQYAHLCQQEYVAQYRLSLREMGLAQAVVTMASPYLALPESMQSASLDEQAEWYWQNWLPPEGKVLVILDDVTDLKSIPDHARPLSERFKILVTTRKRKLSPQFAEIPLRVISDLEALELLEKLLGVSRVEEERSAAEANALNDALSPFSVTITEIPLTPEVVLKALKRV